MKNLKFAGLLLIGSIALAGCGSDESTSEDASSVGSSETAVRDTSSEKFPESLIEIRKTLDDGRTIICLSKDDARSGVSCDWNNPVTPSAVK